MKIELALPGFLSAQGPAFWWSYLLETRSGGGEAAAPAEVHDFLQYCMLHYPASRAQLLQDLYVLFKLGGRRGGYFVEFGACDGVTLSNTYLLESAYGWSGVLAEPAPVWHERLRTNRRCHVDTRCVWSQSGVPLEFLTTPDTPELATVEAFAATDSHAAERARQPGSITVQTVSLNDLLTERAAPRDIDYLSVDTEGSEYEILSALDFSRFRPCIITVEHNHNQSKRRAIEALLGREGYSRELDALTQFDDWYCHSSVAR